MDWVKQMYMEKSCETCNTISDDWDLLGEKENCMEKVKNKKMWWNSELNGPLMTVIISRFEKDLCWDLKTKTKKNAKTPIN